MLAAITCLTAYQASAATQGTTHDHPISDTQTQQYLKDYMGITNYSGSNWGYTATKYNKTYYPVAPTATQAGDVIFVEVNDYWKGSDWDATPSLYNQVKYGVKAIHKVGQSATIGSGDLYHYDATTNRFFFAMRTSDMYTGSASWTEISKPNYRLSESYKMPLRWYNEFSACSNTSVDGWNVLDESYDALKDGDFQNVPHSCSNSLEKNHFTTLYGKTEVAKTYTVSAMLYIPTGAKPTVNNKNGSYSGSDIPKVFFYINKLQGERVAASTSSKFAINLDWTTSIDKAKKADSNFKTWNGTKGGVKEESHVYRRIEGQDEFTEVYIDNGLVDIKKWTDTTLPKAKANGYDVEYYVITKVITYNAKGERTGEEIASAPTNHVIFHIPGSEQFFELTLDNVFNSKYTPAAGNIRKSYNDIKNNVSSRATEYSPKLSDLKAGDQFVLNREEESKGTTAVNTLKITGVNSGTYAYTLNGRAGSAKWTSIQQVLDLVAKYNDELKSIPGHIYDARYQLIYTSDNTDFCSNIVSAQGKRTDVEVKKIYRSGTPDPSQNATQELYTVDVRFKPILSDDIAHYHIWRNAEEKVVRIGQAGTSFELVGKDEDGNFNIDLGPITPDEDGYITVHVDYAMDKHVCDYEEGRGQALDENDLFFTVEVCTTGNNSYGNSDKATDFNGEPSELVLNTYGTFYVGDATRPGQYCAEISWDKIKNSDNLDGNDYVKDEPDYYTVYRCRVGSDKFEPITKFFRGHNARYDESGKLIEAGEYTLVDQTTDGRPYKFTPAIIEQVLRETGDENFYVVDFITDTKFVATPSVTFPATYYVKAHYDSEFKTEEAQWITDDYNTIQNYVEKNSNPTHATTIIVTGVSEKTVSKVVSTTYYSIMGYPVAHPAQGQVVIAQSKHADGSTSAKVVKF